MESFCIFTLTALLVCWTSMPTYADIPAEQAGELRASTKRIARRSVTNMQGAMDYLMYYHHMDDADDDIAAALASFQLLANLTVTGELNDETMDMMNQPRCGVQDHMGTGNKLRRRRYDVITRWPTNKITWRISSFTSDLSQEDVINTLKRAFGMWAEHAELTFTQVTNPNERNVDFEIKFESGDHGDGPTSLIFDNRGGVLGHAFFPDSTLTEPSLAGDIHFDKDEEFTLNQKSGTNLLQLAVHEIGHALGLGHSDDPESVMSILYTTYDPHFRLGLDDIEGIKYLYGRRGGPGYVTMKPNPGIRNCPTGSLDAIVGTDDAKIYAFQGKFVWQIGDIETGIEDGYPMRIADAFPQLPSDIDAGIFHHHKFYFFKGTQYYEYTSKRSFVRKRAIAHKHGWKGVPNDIDAVFHWSGNGKIYFIKGNKYYRYSTFWHTVEWGYPKSLSKWNLGFDVVDAVLQFGHSPTYFFTGPYYYRYNDQHDRPEEGYPRITTHWWFGCGFANLESGSALIVPGALTIVLSVVCSLAALF